MALSLWWLFWHDSCSDESSVYFSGLQEHVFVGVNFSRNMRNGFLCCPGIMHQICVLPHLLQILTIHTEKINGDLNNKWHLAVCSLAGQDLAVAHLLDPDSLWCAVDNSQMLTHSGHAYVCSFIYSLSIVYSVLVSWGSLEEQADRIKIY